MPSYGVCAVDGKWTEAVTRENQCEIQNEYRKLNGHAACSTHFSQIDIFIKHSRPHSAMPPASAFAIAHKIANALQINCGVHEKDVHDEHGDTIREGAF